MLIKFLKTYFFPTLAIGLHLEVFCALRRKKLQSSFSQNSDRGHSLIRSRFFQHFLPPPSPPVTKCHTKLPPK